MTNDLAVGYRELMADVYELAGRSRVTSESFARGRGHTAARWHILSVVLEEPHTVPEVAARLGLRRQSVQRVVDDLVGADLVELNDNPRHQRSRLVTITPSGAKLAEGLFQDSAIARSGQIERAGLSYGDLVQARRTLRRLIDSLDAGAEI